MHCAVHLSGREQLVVWTPLRASTCITHTQKHNAHKQLESIRVEAYCLLASGCGACIAHLQHPHHRMQHVQPAEGSYGSPQAHAERGLHAQCHHLQCSHLGLWQSWPTRQSYGGVHAHHLDQFRWM